MGISRFHIEIFNRFTPQGSPKKALGLSLALAMGYIVAACSSSGDGSDSDSVAMQDEVNIEDDENGGADDFVADNDIAMTVRSVADAINVGEPIDSAGYSFEGVLTDGSGMPLFTDIEGLPGEWKIDVVNPRMVRIRNMNVGDLLPANLVEYLAQALQISDGESLEMVSSYSDGDREVSVFDFGRGTLTIESASATDDATGEAGAKMQITLEAVEPQGGSPTPPDTIVASPKPSMPSPSGKVASSANRKHTSKNASKGS